MRKVCIVLSVISIFYSSPLFANNKSYFEKFESYARFYTQKYLGNHWATKLFGEESHIKMPHIPPIGRNPSSLKSYKLKDQKLILNPERLEKYHVLFIEEVYFVTKNEKVRDEDLAHWISVLRQGGLREGIYRGIVLDAPYGRLESYDNPINDVVIHFSIDFMGKYINKAVSKKAFEGANFFTLKRILVERSLEVIDVLTENPNGLYDWYAILSSDLAQKFPNVFIGKMRKEVDEKIHHLWAKSAGEEFIKSEVIIKLHKIFNHMMPFS